MKSLDKFDIEILEILQKNNYTSHREIGEKVNLSVAAVQRRIKRMETEGVIRSHISVLNPLLINEPITLIVEVVLEHEKIQLIDETKRIFKNVPEVQQCYYVTGDVAFILIILVDNMSHYEQLTRRVFLTNNNIKRFTSFITLDRVKVGLEVPLPKL